ncbi:SGNH/GDSL hydrolase family protein [Pedobacter sp.]|uniref:SGNH/GDSL hydrolase family protein n=1 Tax=Pedobacter sp. TaxID=1411316 RepID=UPI003BA88B9A
MKKTTLFLVLFSLLAHIAISQEKVQLDERYKPFINLEEYMQPFWNASTITDETVMVIRDGEINSVTLLYQAAEILSVRSTDHSITYTKGKDWILRNGKLIILPNSRVPCLNKADLVFKHKKEGFSMTGKLDSTFVLFKEGLYFQSQQISVSYKRKPGDRWQGAVPVINDDALPITRVKLKSKQPVKICFLGNSIEVGYNSSGLMNGAPYMPSWPELVTWKLKDFFQNEIIYSNPSVAGKMASWGAEKAAEIAAKEKPDLLVIGFGMNDGASKVAPDEYLKNIRKIINSTLEINPATEFILISPMLANPNAIQDGIQGSYAQELKKLSSKNIAIVDMTGVHKTLLTKKNYQDMTGNNVNHPNDYLSRWYAQMICGLFIN